VKRRFAIAAALYGVLLCVFWRAAIFFRLQIPLGPTLASFALLFAPFWFFGFGAAAVIRRKLPRGARIAGGALFVLPYMAFAIPLHRFDWTITLALLALAVAVAALLSSAEHKPAALEWQDGLALALIAGPILFNWFRAGWPVGGLGSFPKLLFTDVALYGFLVCRSLPAEESVGYSFVFRWRDLLIGFREWLLFAPFGIGLGLALGFIRFSPRVPSAAMAGGAWLVTFFFVAVPEELFFRGLLLNLLLPRLGRPAALISSAIIFGFSHFNKGARFNWRYVLLASIAGVLYGRAWLDRRRIFSSAITHTAVDVTWSLWFR